jgi:hypothetical protein
MELTPTYIEIIDGVLIVLFALYVLFCLGAFSKEK